MRHALEVFNSRALYTYIPKNACSTLRFSIAQANGFVEGLEQIDWIHQNNDSFLATEVSAARADHAFVVLRCPFTRILSAFMDKIVGFEVHAWQFMTSVGLKTKLYDLSFSAFLDGLSRLSPGRMDHHWRPQVDFLLFDKYDHYVRFERFSDEIPEIERRAGICVTDTREALAHDTSKLTPIETLDAANTQPAIELLQLKLRGEVPSPRLMFGEQEADIVKKIYAEDMALYASQFGPSELMRTLM